MPEQRTPAVVPLSLLSSGEAWQEKHHHSLVSPITEAELYLPLNRHEKNPKPKPTTSHFLKKL